MAKPFTLDAQFAQAASALHEAEHLHRARYWAACVSHSYQVALRCAAGLLYAQGTRPRTEREVRHGFAAAMVGQGRSDERFDHAFRALERMRQRADFEADHPVTEDDATHALELARAFWHEAHRLRGVGDAPESSRP